ncbi:hypothetical protein JXJ21_25915 [candidate division KSB1 bacterium]|nr:hypothetical protein [candidate division KSB1 bacterium]
MPGLEGSDGSNINGPSVIRIPDWLPNPLGRYYLYFADHGGNVIRLAYADSLSGPWKIYRPGTLQLEQTAALHHIASPDVHVDNVQRKIRMYFHGVHRAEAKQVSFVAHSDDGIGFVASEVVLGWFYFRVFRYDGWFYAIAKKGNTSGLLYRSRDGLSTFEEGIEIIPKMRHAAVLVERKRLHLFFSRIGDQPESILHAEIDLNADWHLWSPTESRLLLQPEMDYEGGALALQASNPGAVDKPVRQLRDPCIFVEDEKHFLFYSIAGEQGIAMAELVR